MSVVVPPVLEILPGKRVDIMFYLSPPEEMSLPRVFAGGISIEGTYGEEEKKGDLGAG